MGTLRLATRGSPLALRQTELVTELLRQAHPGPRVEPLVVRTQGDRDADVAARPDRGPGRVRHRGRGGRGRGAGRGRRALGQGHAVGDAGRASCWARCRRGPTRATAWWAATLAGLPAGGAGGHRLGPAPGPAGRRCAPISSSPTCGGTWPAGWPWPRRARSRPSSSPWPPWSGWAGTDQVRDVLDPRRSCCPRRGRAPSRCSAGPTTPPPVRLLAAIDHEPSHRALRAERAVLAALGGSCALPVGAFAEPRRDRSPGSRRVGPAGQRGRAHRDPSDPARRRPRGGGRRGGPRPARRRWRRHRGLRRPERGPAP